MPRTRRRNYRGGGPKEDCEAWVKNPKNGLGGKEGDCKLMSNFDSDVTFYPKPMFFGTQKPPDYQGKPLASAADWAVAYNTLKDAQNAEEARMAASNAKSKQEYDMANKSVVQKCNAYNKITGKLVYKKDANTREDTNCDRTGIQDCTEWRSTPGPDGKPLKWFITDNQGNICNKEKQEFNDSGNFYRTDDRKTFESINGGIVPLKNPPKLMNGMPYPYTGEDKYEMFYQPILKGGRRKSRKSRR